MFDSEMIKLSGESKYRVFCNWPSEKEAFSELNRITD